MANNYFQFKEFTIQQEHCAMKICTDSCLMGAWLADKIIRLKLYPQNILDVGGGTGLLSLMLAQKVCGLTDAVELDPSACSQMRSNFYNSPWRHRLHAIHADVRMFDPGKKYDIIVSNPPFYEQQMKGVHKEKTMAMHDSGLLLNELVVEIKKHLVTGGFFCIMIPAVRADFFESLLRRADAFIIDKILVRQHEKKSVFRVIYFATFNRCEQEPTKTEITIKERGYYTQKFSDLLEDYYLH